MVNWTGQSLNRDECRTPMLWDTTTNAGFSSGNPWLPVSENYEAKAVSVQEGDEESLMNFYKHIIKFRNENQVLQQGNFMVDEELSNGKLFAFHRELDGDKFLVLMNFSEREIELEEVSSDVVFSTHSIQNSSVLHPLEGRILKVD
jgi:glycosidase